jgi:hypothetical protein
MTALKTKIFTWEMVLLCVQKRYKILDGIALYVSGYLPTKTMVFEKVTTNIAFIIY